MDTIARIWSDVGSLKLASAWLQWLSISLVFFSGFLQVGKFLVDRREKALSSAIQAELLNPAAQPIRVATTTVEVVIDSAAAINSNFMDSGGYLAFGKAGQALMVLSATQARAVQTGGNEVIWRGVFEMDASDSSVGKPVRSLRDAEIIQIGFGQLPKESVVKRGKAIVTVNNAVRLEFPIPEQKMIEDRIVIVGLSEHMAALN